MIKIDVISELKKLSTTERLAIIEDIVHLTREEIERHSEYSKNRKQELEVAARALLADYEQNRELTGFTSLDSEDFYCCRYIPGSFRIKHKIC